MPRLIDTGRNSHLLRGKSSVQLVYLLKRIPKITRAFFIEPRNPDFLILPIVSNDIKPFILLYRLSLSIIFSIPEQIALNLSLGILQKQLCGL